jgi:hypothetical protein
MNTKKELKDEYKRKKFRMGVFQIRNTATNKTFIDSSTDLNAIWNRHRFQLNFGNHPNAGLQKDWNALGEDKFKYEILSEIKETDKEMVDYKEEVKLLAEMYIEELQPFDDKGYNTRIKK